MGVPGRVVEIVPGAWNAVVAGPTIRRGCARSLAAGTGPRGTSTSWVSVLPGRCRETAALVPSHAGRICVQRVIRVRCPYDSPQRSTRRCRRSDLRPAHASSRHPSERWGPATDVVLGNGRTGFQLAGMTEWRRSDQRRSRVIRRHRPHNRPRRITRSALIRPTTDPACDDGRGRTRRHRRRTGPSHPRPSILRAARATASPSRTDQHGGHEE